MLIIKNKIDNKIKVIITKTVKDYIIFLCNDYLSSSAAFFKMPEDSLFFILGTPPQEGQGLRNLFILLGSDFHCFTI